MAIAGGNIRLDSTEGVDKITQTDKVTSPYFSNNQLLRDFPSNIHAFIWLFFTLYFTPELTTVNSFTLTYEVETNLNLFSTI